MAQQVTLFIFCHFVLSYFYQFLCTIGLKRGKHLSKTLLLHFALFFYTEKRIFQVQEERKQRIKEVCDGDKINFYKQYIMDDKPYHHLLVDDMHGLIYCYVPKVACTNLKRIMLVLKNGEPYEDPANISINVHNKLPRLTTFSKNEIQAKLKHYTKFLFVRDPFVRLISAYRDKFERLDEHFYTLYGRIILHLFGNSPFPPKHLNDAIRLGLNISFHNFIKYLLDSRTEKKQPFEPHWRQMYRLCHPCQIEYDFIGHQETLQEDVQCLLQVLKLQDDLKVPPSYDNVTSLDSVQSWFRTVPLKDRRKLYKLYEKDFMLFGYRKPDELSTD
uniref:Carbohydrate sulfotransferase n=1 Tax=Cynoglossus semilaevis TaxID=244447 RepID=A0A3P8WME0_CYNSE